MGKAVLQKIRITGLENHYKILMQELHRGGLLELIENEEFIQNSVEKINQHFEVFDLARIDFAIKFLAPFEKPKPFFDKVFAGGKIIITEEDAKDRLKKIISQSNKIITECEEIEYETSRIKQEIIKTKDREHTITPLKPLQLKIGETFDTPFSKTILGFLTLSKKDDFIQKIAQESRLSDIKFFGTQGTQVLTRITFHTSAEEKISDILKEFDIKNIDFGAEFSEFFGQTPREILRNLEKNKKELETKIKTYEHRRQSLGIHLEDLQILSDYNGWKKKKHDLQHRIFRSKKVFVFEAWMPVQEFDALEKWIINSFVQEVSLEKVNPKADEEAPVLMKNKKIFAPFEFITEMFGTPDNKDLDPTPFLAPFFFIFFGLSLSDVGYGGILSILSLFFLIFGKMSPIGKRGVLLFFFCGISATIGGIVLGGYFGMTPEVLPEILKTVLLTPEYLAGNLDVMPFRGQLINPMSGSGPITFLIITLAIGMGQILFGLALDFYKKIKSKQYGKAFFDSLTWFYFLSTVVLFVLAEKIGMSPVLAKNLIISAIIFLILTQGRDQKNWLLKPVFGVLGLYDVTGYLSDILSYSRIMALGLATGVIGFAMNLTAGVLYDMMPHWTLGILVAIVIILFGHTLNFALSLLGAFVHSGRLQFIEFFGKFFDGGGRKFTPFQRQKKYLFFLKN